MGEFTALRQKYHKALCRDIFGYRGNSRIPNIADKDSPASTEFAIGIANRMDCKITHKNIAGQTLGQKFTEITAEFVRETFITLKHLRPGNWEVSTSQASSGITLFDQYEHLGYLQRILNENPELKTALGGDYLVTPDILISRRAEPDEKINEKSVLIESKDRAVNYSPLREKNVPKCPSILHATVSCKWTIRSDRAQNTRTEALNLIRNRKGNTPHIVCVTFEPYPGRLASLALGTGDLDCMYHAALFELMDTIGESKRKDQFDLIEQLVKGRRLRDITDLPMDLAV